MRRGQVGASADATAVWDAQAARYGAQERFEARAVEAALRLAAPAEDDRIVDLACGTGLLLRALAARAPRPREAVGVDRSAGMLGRVGPLPPGWRTLRADARCVPLPDDGADVVTCSYLLHLLDAPDRAAVLAEARRLLAPGGGSRLVVVSVWPKSSAPWGRLLHAAFGALAAQRPARLGGLAPLDPTADLHAAGFAVTQRVELPRRGYPSLVLRAEPA
jgi:ubiquinone/menaquinone biosynthesis C-methylase UbiE